MIQIIEDMNILVIFLALILAVTSLRVSHLSWSQYLSSLIDKSRYSEDSYFDVERDESLNTEGDPSIDKGAIISLKDGNFWTSPNDINALQLQPEESQEIAKVMKSGDVTPFKINGITVGGVNYQFVSQDGNMVEAKAEGKGSLIIRKTNQAVIFGHMIEGKPQNKARNAVNIMSDYFLSMNM